VLTLHNVLDPVVPMFNEMNYGKRVAAAGTQDLLVQQQVASYGHCNFTTQEQMNSFNALAVWVNNRVQKPASGDVTLP
jgi:hypothetical protein